MAKVNNLIASRFQKPTKENSKMQDLARLSSTGNLSSFSGVFQVTALTLQEEELLRNFLQNYAKEQRDISFDLPLLSAITSEVKAINNQAAILHGERIKKAQELLKPYKEGAFSAWLIHTYGNRQTPYNFLQYYELYISMPKALQEKVDRMPRQAVYTLATRNCPLQQKQEIVDNYKGETKKELLHFIRTRFPLPLKDKRIPNFSKQLLDHLSHIQELLTHPSFSCSQKQKDTILEVVQSIHKKL